MASYPVEIRRCQHIKTSGAQCGSPALRNEKLCYYHQHNGLAPAELYDSGERYCDSQIMIPPFEDAHSIQMVLRHVVQLMLTRRIDRKDAGLMFYALQIASGNLKQMQAEKPRPTQVVVEPDKVEETPIGMTPWSVTGQGHDPDEEEGAAKQESEAEKASAPLSLAEKLYGVLTTEERIAMRRKFDKEGRLDPIEWENHMIFDGPDPLLLTMRRLFAEGDGQQQADPPISQI